MKITKKLLQDLINEELSLFEGYQSKYFGRHRDVYVPTDIFVYSANSTFDYGMQDEWDTPFDEGRLHLFDLMDKKQFKAFIDFLYTSIRGNLLMFTDVENLHDNYIILDEDPNETFTRYSRDNLSDDEIRALDGKKMKDLLYTEPFKHMLPVSKEELINAGYQLHGVDLTKILAPIKQLP